MPLGFKHWTDSAGVVHGRLEIGYMRQGLGGAYYEPIGNVDPDRGPEVGIYIESRGYKTAHKEPTKGSFESWSPSTADVYWHPWAIPFSGESSTKKGLEIIQRRDLFDMWCYLMATDPDEVAERAEGLNDPGKMRRWAFYQFAKVWKRKDMKMRAEKARRTGKNLGEVELSESEDDEGFEADEEEQRERVRERKRKRGDMPPPARPGHGNKKQKGKGAAAGGGGRAKNGRGANWPPQTPDNLFVSPLVMSGGRGARDNSQGSASRSQSVDIVDGREDSYDSFDFDPRPPQPDGSPARGFGGGLAGSNYVHPTVETDYGSSDDETVARLRRLAEANGTGVDAEVEVERLIRETSKAREEEDLTRFGDRFGSGLGVAAGRGAGRGSSALWDELNGGLDDDAAELEAIRASLAPEERSTARDGAARPFETGDEDTSGTGVNGQVNGGAQSNTGARQNGHVSADGENGTGEDDEDGANDENDVDDGEGEDKGEGE